MNAAAITFDVDWAPDWAILDCAELCTRHGVPATFFFTHESSTLRALREMPNIELGIHPNFLPGSTHGSDEASVLSYCLDIVPEAKAMRTHGLYQSSHLFALIGDRFRELETDVSLFLPLHRGLAPTDIYFGRQHRRITRLPYFWEDDDAAQRSGWTWDEPMRPSGGLEIFDFHPIHVALNMSDLRQYEDMKQALGPRALVDLRRREVMDGRSRQGTRTYLEAVVATWPASAFMTISQITERYRGGR